MPKDNSVSYRAVIDTNIFVSMLFGKRIKTTILELVDQQRFILITSSAQIEELRRVLARPHITAKASESDLLRLINTLSQGAEQIVPAVELQLCRDKKDNYLLDIAATAHADFLVTGDKDMLDDAVLKATMLDEYSVAVVTVVAFLQKLDVKDAFSP